MKRATLGAGLIALGLVPLLVVAVINRPHAQRSAYDGSRPPSGPYRGSEPPANIPLPRFALRSYRGETIRSGQLRGRVVLITFLDTKCRTKCPVFAADIGAALRLLEPAELSNVTPLAISVEPKTDTPTNVRAFLRRRHAQAIDFLIGPRPALRAAWRAFRIVAAAETGSADVHSADLRIFDRRGTWVSTLHAGVDLTPANLAHDIRTALRGAA